MPATDPQRFLPLPTLSFYVLLALGQGAAHGWAIIKRIAELSDHATTPSSGSLYLAMVRLQDSDLIEAAPAPAGEDARRRYYRLTTLGRRVVAAESRRLSNLVRHARKLDLLQEPK